jgi:Na+/melibiose symporter-like transporter
VNLRLTIKHKYRYQIKNIIAIISAIVVAVWTYFGLVERLNRLETNEKLMAQDLLKKAEQTPKNQEMYMLN